MVFFFFFLFYAELLQFGQKRTYEKYPKGPQHLSLIIEGINRSASDRYRGWKNKLHTHFKQKGPDIIPDKLNAEVWKKCIEDIYTNEEWLVKTHNTLYIFFFELLIILFNYTNSNLQKLARQNTLNRVIMSALAYKGCDLYHRR